MYCEYLIGKEPWVIGRIVELLLLSLLKYTCKVFEDMHLLDNRLSKLQQEILAIFENPTRWKNWGVSEPYTGHRLFWLFE